jgi:hypothetical protein
VSRTWKRHRVTVALVLVAAALAIVAFWDRGRVTTDEATGRKLQLFDAWRPEDVSRIVVEGAGGRVEVVSQLDADGDRTYRLREGDVERLADDQEVDDFLLTLEYAGFERRAEGLDRETLGLEPPHLVVTIAMGKLAYTLRVGGTAPSPEGARYAEVEGGARPKATYVLKPALVKALEEEPRTLRSKQLSPYLSSDVERYELDGPAGRYTLRRAGTGGRTTIDLVVETPGAPPSRASFRTVDAWATTLAKLEAARFVDDPGRSADATKLRVVPRDGKRPTALLELGGSCEGGRLVRRLEPDPAAACVEARLVEALSVPAARFADTYALGLPEADVTEIKLSEDSTTVELARRGEGWHLRKPDEAQLDASVGNALLSRLASAEGELVPGSDAKELGLEPPRARLRIVGLPDRAGGPNAPEHVEELDVGTERDGAVHLRRKTDGALLRLSTAAAAAFLPAPSALRPTQLLDVPMKHVRGLALNCGGKRQELTRDGKGTFTRIAPETALRADLTAASELAEALRSLTAVRWDAERHEPRHGLDAPACSLALTVAVPDAQGNTAPDDPKEPMRTHKLVLGAETEGGYFATLEGSSAVFVAPRPLFAMGREWLLDRGALLVDAAEVERVVVAVGERRLEVLRRGDAWALATQTSPNDTRATTVGKALEALLAEGVVTLGKAAKDEGFDAPKARVSIVRREGSPTLELVVGATADVRGARSAFVRRGDIEATFAVSLARLSPILDAP